MKDDRLISLNAAIDAMLKLQTEDIEAYGASIPEGFDGDRAVMALKALPSAQPWCEDTVYRKAVQMLLAYFVPEERYAEAVDGLRRLPSAQPTGTNTVQVDDCISRAAIVDAIEGVDWYHMTDSGEMVHGANSAEHQAWYKAEDIYAAIEALPSAQPGWIPVTEGLPKPNEEDGNGFYKAYLVQDGRWMDVARWDGKYWIAWGYSTVLLNVVAWCELLTPYREGGQDE